jgi:para-aminobenzoate synthetase component I
MEASTKARPGPNFAMNIAEFITLLNGWGRKGIPFLFLVDFEMKKPLAIRLDELDPEKILFHINGITNAKTNAGRKAIAASKEIIGICPIPMQEYHKKYEKVIQHLAYGDSYLTNLTVETGIQLLHDFGDLFYLSKAKYKLLFQDQFLVFSPEIFVQIKGGRIYSYPMKGTIDATVTNAREKILADKKELAEHVTIVDLIRNDLSQVANRVAVERFRYIDELKTDTKTLLQVSSEIAGDLPKDYASHLGEILITLLPAGSVSGAPKPKTLMLIREVEGVERGYYTGVFGYYDGHELDSGVMIRFIEKKRGGYVYRSGGGITTQSTMDAEYQEAIDKVYVPFD